ncbi:hypothetical protein QQ020_35745 [Fulvivirgaceae bacterium BMA12]|uniref:Uncharacterized protein n=1 Tax=Agaribacillus aureus TaxID=3051825 RepID=A0ABT8LKF3_9BACT|nr:hypothetical protein [Fulvivirgaceae bacterium BMA12]
MEEIFFSVFVYKEEDQQYPSVLNIKYFYLEIYGGILGLCLCRRLPRINEEKISLF